MRNPQGRIAHGCYLRATIADGGTHPNVCSLFAARRAVEIPGLHARMRRARGKAAKRGRPARTKIPGHHRLPSSFLVEILRMSPGVTEFAAAGAAAAPAWACRDSPTRPPEWVADADRVGCRSLCLIRQTQFSGSTMSRNPKVLGRLTRPARPSLRYTGAARRTRRRHRQCQAILQNLTDTTLESHCHEQGDVSLRYAVAALRLAIRRSAISRSYHYMR